MLDMVTTDLCEICGIDDHMLMQENIILLKVDSTIALKTVRFANL